MNHMDRSLGCIIFAEHQIELSSNKVQQICLLQYKVGTKTNEFEKENMGNEERMKKGG